MCCLIAVFSWIEQSLQSYWYLVHADLRHSCENRYHREDEEALRTYMDRLHNDPDVVRHTGGCDEEGLAKLEQLIKEQAQGQPH